jgi:hypothetical protein
MGTWASKGSSLQSWNLSFEFHLVHTLPPLNITGMGETLGAADNAVHHFQQPTATGCIGCLCVILSKEKSLASTHPSAW